MKKILLASLLMLAITGNFAQEGRTPGADKMPATNSEVPSMIIDRFNREYPGISGTWTKDGENFRVEFTDPKSHLGHIIVYDRNGDVLRRESELDGPSNPNAINDFYKTNFPGEQLKTWSVEEKDGTVSYYTKRKEEILRFNKEGKPAATAPAAKDGTMQKSGRHK